MQLRRGSQWVSFSWRLIEQESLLLGYRNGIVIEGDGSGGGLALLWDDEVTISIRQMSKHFIDVFVESNGNWPLWPFTGFYREPNTGRRQISLDLLVEFVE
ncbi:hypothetical protein Droror1_Dr00004395 [Drosera rotundifolia]